MLAKRTLPNYEKPSTLIKLSTCAAWLNSVSNACGDIALKAQLLKAQLSGALARAKAAEAALREAPLRRLESAAAARAAPKGPPPPPPTGCASGNCLHRRMECAQCSRRVCSRLLEEHERACAVQPKAQPKAQPKVQPKAPPRGPTPRQSSDSS
ncbi:unnamed protein product [Symbiodinium natans]|uniref:Uncharacterized protein n=1 Tax=Symbiodinium natans TaxID=878477 RepID=A0A812GJY4_9DINO|nr:unnamed protein product [Symbiodinium natans]